jgi:1-acyl-sn-glycerol-3-phosphate acyltransferase
MRRFWKLLRIGGLVLAHTLYASFALRRRAPAERAAFRAHRQRVGCRALCRILNVEVSCTGPVPEGARMLLVCNHFGILDPLVLATQMPVAFVSKAEVRGWPLIGRVTRLMGVIFVERERRTQAGDFVRAVQSRLREGVHVLAFPEGTTSGTEAVLPFKTGAFAAVAGLGGGAVLPLYLKVESVNGRPAVGALRERVVWSDKGFARHAWEVLGLRSVRLQVRVGEPVPSGGQDRKALALLAHAQVCALGGVEGA